jgi:hypothetical protein
MQRGNLQDPEPDEDKRHCQKHGEEQPYFVASLSAQFRFAVAVI